MQKPLNNITKQFSIIEYEPDASQVCDKICKLQFFCAKLLYLLLNWELGLL